MAPAEIARTFPGAVAFARAMREAFGEGVRLVRATNAAGEQLGRAETAQQITAPFREPDSLRRRPREA